MRTMNKRFLSLTLTAATLTAGIIGVLAPAPGPGSHVVISREDSTPDEQRRMLAASVLAASLPQSDGSVHPRTAGAVASLMSPATDPGCALPAVEDYFAGAGEVEANGEMLEGMVDLLAGDISDRFADTALSTDRDALSAIRAQTVAVYAEPYRELIRLGTENGAHEQERILEQELFHCAAAASTYP